MPGSNPSVTDIDIGFRLLGTVERLLLRRHDEQTAEFARAQDVNPLHHRGFLSIGCALCTCAIAPGEAERAGRWRWEEDETRERGLHLRDGRLVRAGA